MTEQPLELWVNVYADNLILVHDTEESAILNADDPADDFPDAIRIAVHMTEDSTLQRYREDRKLHPWWPEG